MNSKRVDGDKYEILLTSDEMMIITNCINEVCNELSIPEFHPKIGAERDEIESLLDSLLAISKG
jgi:hypothetical protein